MINKFDSRVGIAAVPVLLLILIQSTIIKADWRTEANARIEQIRKTSAEITVLGTGNNPVPDVNVQIQQTRHRFAFGTCIAYGALTGSSQTNYRNFILSHFNWAVCENESKWPANEPSRDSETYTQADYIYNWCSSNGIKMRGHCLFWEQTSSVPSWVQSLGCSDMQGEINERINNGVAHFRNKFHHWDVDNEMLNNDFYGTCLGEQGRANMFIRAHQVDPNCMLFMNEYNGNSFGGYSATDYINRTLNLISLGAPIHAIGLQGHVASPFDSQGYYSLVLEPLRTGLGLPIWVTEYDSSTPNVTQRANDLDNFYRICFSHPSVEGILMWGFWDGSQWRADAQLVETDWTINEAGLRYENLLNQWTTNDANVTNAIGKAGFRGFHGTYQITLSKPGETTEIHTIELEPNSSIVQFTIDTNFVSGPPDTTPPTPDPMTWASNPAATGDSSIEMTATTASDISGVEYYFDCLTAGGHDSGWQNSTYYEDTGLDPNTQYSYRVQARDKSPAQNETGWSSTLSTTTEPPDTTPPTPNPMTWATVPTATGPGSITMTATTASDTSGVEYYFNCLTAGGHDSGWTDNPTYTDTGLVPSTSYTYRVQARDKSQNQNAAGWSSSLAATTQAPIIELLGSWVTGTTHAKEAGGSRALIFIAHAEYSTTLTLNSVTYGGQAMTPIVSRTTGGTAYQAYAAAYILNEADINAVLDGTFNPVWNTTPENVSYASVFLSNVSQTTPVGPNDSNSTATATPNPIKTNPLPTNDGDMVIDAAVCGNTGDYTLQNGFTEALEHDMTSSTGTDGYKSATGAAETPSAQHTSVNRQCIIGFVIQAAQPPEYENCGEVIADNHRLAADIAGSGDCYVDFDDLYTFADNWLRQDCISPNNCSGADFDPTDGVVDFVDFGDFAEQWLTCNDPANPGCPHNW